MAEVETYYDIDRKEVPYFALHIALKDYFANKFFFNDINRIVYTNNENALRKRMDYITKNDNTEQTVINDELRKTPYLNFPFMNYKRTGWDYTDEFNRWTLPGYAEGIYIDELGLKIRIKPHTLTFSGIFWVDNESDLAQANRIFKDEADNLTNIDYSIEIDTITIPMWSDLRYTSTSYDPSYNDNDWLEQNNIHTITFDFDIYFFDIAINRPEDGTDPPSYSLTEEVIYNYKVNNYLGNVTDEEVYTFLYNELNP